VTEESVGNGVTTVRQFDRSDERLRRIAAQGHDGTQILNLALEYDLIGNLKSRLETIGRKKETFEYDEINRLVAMVSTSSGRSKYKYDTAGRLIFKSGVGVYHYADSDLAPPENDDQPSANAQRYARPLHSVLRTAPENDDQPSANAQRYARPLHAVLRTTQGHGDKHYKYDLNGNMISSSLGHFDYTSDNHLSLLYLDEQKWSKFDYVLRATAFANFRETVSSRKRPYTSGSLRRLSITHSLQMQITSTPTSSAALPGLRAAATTSAMVRGSLLS
jgi:YD repeat-containing protein